MKKLALILDDEPTICILLQEILKINNIPSVIADSIKNARLLLNEHTPDYAFIDHRLPDGYGLEFIPELRSKCLDAYIIIMTAQENFEQQEIESFGANIFIPKPFEIDRILKMTCGEIPKNSCGHAEEY